jgi:hypothetical protein
VDTIGSGVPDPTAVHRCALGHEIADKLCSDCGTRCRCHDNPPSTLIATAPCAAEPATKHTVLVGHDSPDARIGSGRSVHVRPPSRETSATCAYETVVANAVHRRADAHATGPTVATSTGSSAGLHDAPPSDVTISPGPRSAVPPTVTQCSLFPQDTLSAPISCEASKARTAQPDVAEAGIATADAPVEASKPPTTTPSATTTQPPRPRQRVERTGRRTSTTPNLIRPPRQ